MGMVFPKNFVPSYTAYKKQARIEARQGETQ
jgi:hypothetical protein